MVTIPLIIKGKSHRYNIVIGNNHAFASIQRYIRETRPSGVFVLSNKKVYRHYAEKIETLKKLKLPVFVYNVPDGEKYKNINTLEKILTVMLRRHLDRKSLLVAIGGGVVGDMGGFAASCYMRGIACLQVPTTLLAMVDSSVGGKTAVNSPYGKNMIGAFHQPAKVIIDVNFLKTLPLRELKCGMAEIIKHGLIQDSKYFQFLKNNQRKILALHPNVMQEMVAWSCRIKSKVVQKDEKEQGIRAILNFGHTGGHAIEKLTGYKRFSHGEAVAMGMGIAVNLSIRSGDFPEKYREEIFSLIESFGLSLFSPDFAPHDVIQAMKYDKKALSGKIRFVLLKKRIGMSILRSDVPLIEVKRSILDLKSIYERGKK